VAKNRPAYQDPPPPELATNAWKREHLTVHDVFRIGAWKSVKGLGWLTLNAEDQFASITGEAMVHLKPWHGKSVLGNDADQFWQDWHSSAQLAAGSNIEPKSGLMRLSGVSYPMATAILCVLDEQVWPVMDRFAVRTVFGTNDFYWKRADVYESFTRWLATRGPSYWGVGKTVHALDQEAMHASMPDGGLPQNWLPTAIP
jgi:hypothetical protein